MSRKKIVDEERDLEVLDLREIKPDNLLEIKDVIEKDEAIELDREVKFAGYDIEEDEEVIEILGDDE